MADESITYYTAPVESDDEENTAKYTEIMAAMPFAIVSSEEEAKTADGKTARVRSYPWGQVEVENDEHCDFRKLRSLLIRIHMFDLIQTTAEIHYENYRAELLENGDSVGFISTSDKEILERQIKEDEEALRKKFTEQVKNEESRFRAWEKKLIAERDKLNQSLEAEHLQLKALQDEINELQNRDKLVK